MNAQRHLERYLEESKLAEIAQHYEALGYQVEAGKEGFDLVAKRGDDRIAFEIKVASTRPHSQRTISKLRSKAKRLGMHLNIVLLRKPHQIEVEIENLEEILHRKLKDDVPEEIRELSSNSIIEEVADLEIDRCRISKTEISLRGTGYIGVELNYGGSRDGATAYEGYPFSFEVILDHDLSIASDLAVQVDVSSFYK